jgi:V8-like Glu-specific endopeptidase
MRHRLSLAVLAGIFSLLGCSGSTGTTDEPVGASFEPIVGGVPATAYPEAAFLNIDVPAAGGTYWACSGTVIAPRVVLTAGHCVDGHSTWAVFNGSQYRLSTTATTYDWHEDGGTTVDPSHHDIGLVFLASDIVLPSYPTLAATAVAAGTDLVNVGRIASGTFTDSLYEATGPVTSAAPSYPFDYAATDLIQPGDSGGPDFVAGTHTIAAVNSGAGNGTEILARVDLLQAWIEEEIAAHPGSAGADAGMDAGTGMGTDAGTGTGMGMGTDAGAGVSPAVREQEPNNSLAAANPIGGSRMGGAIDPSTDIDWFTLTVPVGRTTVVLEATGDAVFAAGVISGGTCPFSVAAASRVTVAATGRPVDLCVYVSSPKHDLQLYTLYVGP